MTLSMYVLSIETFAPMLRNLSGLLGKAGAGGEGALNVDALAGARLARDMFTLAEQVRLACQHAGAGAARLMGWEPPAWDHGGETLEGLSGLIAATIAYLDAAPEDAFAGAEDRWIIFDVSEGLELRMKGVEFLKDWALPHFYFHVVTAYDILRHNGIPLGKQDYLHHAAAFIHARPGGPAAQGFAPPAA